MLWTVSIIVFFLLIPLPLRSTRTHTRFPYTTLFRSAFKKRGLGRGLDALLSGPTVSSLEEQAVQVDQRELQHLPLDLIQRGKYQPRRDMDPQALQELAQSIKSQGVMQPIVVRPIAKGRFEVIFGERHRLPSQQPGQETLPG